MSAHEVSHFGESRQEATPPRGRDIIPRAGEAQAASQSPFDTGRTEPTRMLALVPVAAEDEQPNSLPAAPTRTFMRLSLAAAVAVALAAAIGAAALLVNEHRRQSYLLAMRAHETESLAQSVKALSVRLDAIEGAKSVEGLADLRRSIGQMKSGIASARDLGGALAQLSQRVEKLDREESAMVDRGRRLDRDASMRAVELSARIERLERRPVAPIVAATSGPAPSRQAGQTAAGSRLGPNVSMETTGSIQRPRPVLQGYIVLDGRYDAALVDGRYGEREVRLGDFLPGAGRVERIERRGGGWVVLTDEGLIAAAENPPY